MNATYIVLPVLIAWTLTGLFIIPVTVTLALMVSQRFKAKWTQRLPVVAGILMCIPVAWFTRGLHIATEVPLIGGMELSWLYLVVGAMNALLGAHIGYQLSKRIVD